MYLENNTVVWKPTPPGIEYHLFHFINKLGLWIFTGRSPLRERRYMNTEGFTQVSALEVESKGEHHCTEVTWLVISFKL